MRRSADPESVGLSLDFYGSGFPTFSCDDTGGVTTIYNPVGWTQLFGADGICFTGPSPMHTGVSYKAVCMGSSSLLSPSPDFPPFSPFPPAPPSAPPAPPSAPIDDFVTCYDTCPTPTTCAELAANLASGGCAASCTELEEALIRLAALADGLICFDAPPAPPASDGDDPCFARSSAHTCRLLDPTAPPAAALADCFHGTALRRHRTAPEPSPSFL